MRAPELPLPDADALACSEALTRLIAGEIAAGGPMPFRRYMELALYAPGLGYYAAGARKFGAAGDFITAPELGNLLAEAWAHALAPVLAQQTDSQILELGAGSGALAADLLAALARRGIALERYLILDRSADLRQRQAERLADSPWRERVVWLDAPPTATFHGAIIGNEVVDALACTRFTIGPDGPLEMAVDTRDGRLVETLLPAQPALLTAVNHLQAQGLSLPPGYSSEVLPELPAWLQTVSAGLIDGVVLLADYGYGRPEYYHPDRRQGTLICHYRHRAHADPYHWPGLTDLSAFVDFTALAEAGLSAGFDLLSYHSQAGFLLDLGLAGLIQDLDTLPERPRLALTQQIKRLMLPGDMGERFKIMALGRGPSALNWPLDGPGQRRLL